MLKLENYSIQYENKTIKFPNIIVKEREFVGLSGDSGCGKTSLLNSLFAYDFKGKTKAKTMTFQGKNINTLGKNKYKHISYCPQFAQDALNPKLTIKQHIDLVLSNNKNHIDKMQLETLLAKLKLTKQLLQHYPYMLSGGQKQRLILLLCYIKNPKLLVLDEPSSAIDIISLKIIVEFLKEIKGTITIIMVSHNKEFLAKLCDRIIEIGGKDCANNQ